MTLLKLTYYPRKDDEFQYATVIGDIYSIYDLYFRMKSLNLKTEVSSVITGIPLDMSKSLNDIIGRSGRLNTCEKY